MRDEELRVLEREGRADPWARWRWRSELVRLGRGAEAGIEPGDTLLLELRRRNGLDEDVGPPASFWRVVVVHDLVRRIHLLPMIDPTAEPEDIRVALGGEDVGRNTLAAPRVTRFDKFRGSASKLASFLATPARPDEARELSLRTGVHSACRARAAHLLELTWCVGAGEEETRAVLRAFEPTHSRYDWASMRRKFWHEAKTLTNHWGQGPPKRNPGRRLGRGARHGPR